MAAESHGAQARSARVEAKTYKSPQYKLVPFFAQSRDQWKAKCRGAKARLKQLKKKVQRGDARHRRQQERLQALAKAGAVASGESPARGSRGGGGKKGAGSCVNGRSACPRLRTASGSIDSLWA